MPTLSTLLTELADKYNTAKRPKRYFDVRKRGALSASEVRYVKKRFKELADREICVKKNSKNPECYDKVTTDRATGKKRKSKSGYLRDYERIYRDEMLDVKKSSEYKRLRKRNPSIPAGLTRIALETDLPLDVLKEVYDVGVGAYASSGSRPGMSASQWGYGRVYAFIMSYFHNDDGKYSNRRYLQNRTDEYIFDDVT
mgnify:FL=1|tara:strand:+ start:1183 stop:1776 length:594 start_codon:yes stop_codon:yes gene_type:complete